MEHLPQKNSNAPKRATWVRVAIWGYSSSILNTTKTNSRIRIFHTRVKAQNCHGKGIKLTAKKKTSRQKERLTANRIPSRHKEKDSRQREKPHGKKKKTQRKRKPHGKKKKTHGKISSIPRGHFNSYFFCREVVVILFAVRLILLP